MQALDVLVCVCESVYVCVRVSLCVCERERERETHSKRECVQIPWHVATCHSSPCLKPCATPCVCVFVCMFVRMSVCICMYTICVRARAQVLDIGPRAHPSQA